MRRFAFIMIAFLLLAGLSLAALHSHSFWETRGKAGRAASGLTRITSVDATVLETGLRLDDVVTAMSFDSDGNLWLSTPSNGPYFYRIGSDEAENFLRPDTIYGFSTDPNGMWVLTSRGAFLYRETGVIRSVWFPESVIPLCSLRVARLRLFGTTRGLYSVRDGEAEARQEMQSDRITHLHSLAEGALVGGDSGIWRWTPNGIASCVQVRHRMLSGFLGPVDGRILAATGEDGILTLSPRPLKEVRFAVPELNIISPGAVTVHRGKPCFGTYAGAVVYQSKGLWKKANVGEFPVTALASRGDRLFAWSGGKMLIVDF